MEPSAQMRDEKLHVVVARSTFPSQNVQSTSHVGIGTLLEVEMSKKSAPLWREAQLEGTMLKSPMFEPLSDIQMSFYAGIDRKR